MSPNAPRANKKELEAVNRLMFKALEMDVRHRSTALSDAMIKACTGKLDELGFNGIRERCLKREQLRDAYRKEGLRKKAEAERRKLNHRLHAARDAYLSQVVEKHNQRVVNDYIIFS